MKCPNCGNEMVESRAGHLCISCGHIVASTAPAPASTATITTGKDAHDQMTAATGAAASASADDKPAEDKPADDKPADDKPVDDTTKESETTTDVPVEGAPPAVSAAPWEAPADKPSSDSEASGKPADDTTAEVKPATPDADIAAVEEVVAKVTGDVPADGDKPAVTDKPADDGADKAATEPPSPEAAAEAEKAATEALAALTGAAPAADAEVKPDEDKGTDDKPADKSDDTDKPDEPAAGDKPADDGAVSLIVRTGGKRIKNDDAEKGKDEPADDKDADKEPPAEHKVIDAPDADSKPDDKTDEAGDKTAEDKPAEDKSDDKPETDESDKPEDEPAADDKEAEDKPAEDDKPDTAEDKPDADAKPADDEADKSAEEDKPAEDSKPEETPEEPSPTVIPSGPDAATSPLSALPDDDNTVPADVPHTEPAPSPTNLGESGAISIPGGSSTPDPAPANEPAPVSMPAAVPAPTPDMAPAAPLNGKPPLEPVTHPRPFNAKLVFALVGGVVAAALIGGVGYAYTVTPKAALADYFKKTGSAKTATFAVTAAFKGDNESGSVKAAGKVDAHDDKNPKLDMELTIQAHVPKGELTETDSTFDASAHLMILDKVFYGKIDTLTSTPKSELTDQIPKTWYKYDYSKSTDPTDKCTDPSKSVEAYLSKNLYENLPVKDAKFLGVSTFDGTQAMHYSGVLDQSKLQAFFDEANKGVSKDCQTDYKADDLKDFVISYELWRGWTKDRLAVTVKDSKDKIDTTVTIDTSDYDKPVTITAPTDAKDLNSLLSGGPVSLGKSTAAVLGASTTAPAVSSAAYDNQRMSDLAQYAAAYRAVSPQGFYAIAPPAVTVTATDPSTHAPYAVSTSAPTAVGQIQYKPGGACTGPGRTPGRTGSRYLALYTLLETGSTYCLDVK
jgi:hypothetical protein